MASCASTFNSSRTPPLKPPRGSPLALAQHADLIAVLCIIGILYGALICWVQRDMKKLVAYSSVSHLGFVMLGMFALNAQGVSGAILQMINHGLSTGALFLLIGMVYEQTHTREIKVYGGLWKIMPVYGTVMLISALSSMGLPGLNGFVGEFTILLGAFGSKAIGSPWYAGVSAAGVIMAAVYILYMFQKMFLGPAGEVTHHHELKDLNWREILTVAPLLIFMFWIGLYPAPFFNLMAPAVNQLLEPIAKIIAALP